MKFSELLALPDEAFTVDPLEAKTRREWLQHATHVGIGVAVAAFPTLFSRTAFAQAASIPEVLNFALTLEYLEARFYTMGVDAGIIPAGRETAIFTLIRDHELAHVDLLRGALEAMQGVSPVAEPTFDFTAGGAFDPFGEMAGTTPAQAYEQFLLLAQAFEDTGVRAYKGQAPALIANDDILTTALQIHSVEARHAAEVRRLRGEKGWITLDAPGAPAAVQPVYAGEAETTQGGVDLVAQTDFNAEAVSESFDEPLTMDEVLAIAGMFIAS